MLPCGDLAFPRLVVALVMSLVRWDDDADSNAGSGLHRYQSSSNSSGSASDDSQPSCIN